MITEETNEELKMKQAYSVYNSLLAEAKRELSKAVRKWETLQNDVVRVMMMEFAASCDDSILLPHEKLMLEEMDEKLRTAENEMDFWSQRVKKLEDYRHHVQFFHARLACDVEMHKLRLTLSKSLFEEISPDSKTCGRAKAY